MERNPLDKLADELADWADDISTQIAQATLGGFAAPGAAKLSEQQKLSYYTRQLFNPDGSPNIPGRTAEMDRLGAEGFAVVYADVTSAHPELAPPPPSEEEPYPVGFRRPTGVPGVSEVTAEYQPQLQPTSVPGVSEIVG